MRHDIEPGSVCPNTIAATLASPAAAFTPPTTVADSSPRWLAVERCPSCASERVLSRQALPIARYYFGDEEIRFPASGIDALTCAECGLVYKNVLPHPQFLSQVFRRQAGKKWMESYDFSDDVTELKAMVGTDLTDVLDVGAGNGDLLKCCAAAGVAGRLSALDVIPHPGLERHLAGEFIQGFLDADALQWSESPYQSVTIFDVLEHLYSPQRAFENLRRLVKPGGLVLLETGNARSAWPRRFGVAAWWYVCLFEHHIFWSQRSLQHIAKRHGFEVVVFQERRHKARRGALTLHAIKDWLKVCVYYVTRGAYARVANYFGKHSSQPCDPFTRDHMRVLLRKR